ncbi:MAG: DUF5011 domain-containing protein [Nitrosopumilus sp.]|nr:DUF5011 domain-containing protein [Nitrosopumilus sp.]
MPHEVEIYCPDEHDNTINNKTADIIVDDTDPVPPEPGDRTLEVGESFAHGQTCAQDTGSPVDQTPVLEIRDAGDNVVGSVDTSSVTTYTIKYTCRDAAGNSLQGAAQTISIRDTTAPVLDGDAPSPAYVMSGPDYVDLDAYTLTCTDDGQPANDRISFEPPLASLAERPAAMPHEVEIYCPDAFRNTINNKTADIIVDDTDPVPPEPDDRTLEVDEAFTHGQTCAQDAGSPVDRDPVLEIRDSGNNVVGSVDTSSVATYTIKYACRDAAGNSLQGTAQTVRVRDTTAPVLAGIAPSPAYVEAGPDYVDLDAYTLTCTDDGQPANDRISFEPPLASLAERPAAMPHEVEIYCPDAFRNTINNKTADIIVDDTDPVPPEPRDRTLEVGEAFAHGQTCAQDTGSPVVLDPILEIRDVADNVVGSVDTSSVTTYTIKYACRDAAGNSLQGAAQTIMIVDTTAPVLDGDAPSPAYVMSGPDYVDLDAYTLTCTDDGQPANDLISFNPPLASLAERPAAMPHEVEIYCPDDLRNTIGNRTVDIIVDGTAPAPPEPAGRNVEMHAVFVHGQTCAQDTGSPVTPEPELEIRNATGHVIGSVDTSSVSTYTIKYTCRDAAGNSLQGSTQTISIRDTTAPVLAGNAPSPAYVMSGPDYVDLDAYTLTCTDDGQPANDRISFEPPLASLAERPAAMPHEVEIYCPDEHDNTIDNKTAEIVVDDTDPVPPEPGNRILEVGESFVHGQTCAQDTGSPVDQTPILEIRDAGDNVVGSVDTSSISTYTIKYTCRDAAGNSLQGAAQTVRVRDTTAPVLAGIAPSPAYVMSGPDYTSYEGYTLTCTDDGQPTNDRIAFEPPLASLAERPAADPHEVEIYCPDEHDNTINNKTVDIIVDDTDPVPPEPGDRTLEADEIFVHGQTCTQDAGSPVDRDPVLEIRDSGNNVVGSVDTSSVSTYTIKYTCRDAAGNSLQGAAQTVRVRDTTAPVLAGVAPSPAYVEAGPDYVDLDAYTLTCTDDGQPANDRISFEPPLASLAERPAAMPHEVEIYCPDEHDNTINNKTADIIVDDTDPAPPEPRDRTLEVGEAFAHGQTCTQDTGSPVTPEPELEIRNATDHIVGSIDTSSVATYTIKYACRDAAGNSKQGAAQMISIRDTTAPALTGNAPSPAYVMSGPDYVDLDAYTLTCTDDGQPANDQISFNPTLASLAERPAAMPHEVEIYCPDEHDNTIDNKTAEIVVDDTDPVPPEPGNRILEVGEAFVHGQTCTQDTGSPVDQAPVLEIRDAGDNVVGSVDTSSISTYTIKYTCRDAAGNFLQGAAQTISVTDTTAPILDGNAPSPAYVEAGPDYTSYPGYTLTCTDGGQPANDQISFNPPLASLAERPATDPHEVEIYCPDTLRNTINNKTADIIVDDTDPVPPEPVARTLEVGEAFVHGQTCAQDTGSPVDRDPVLEIRDSDNNVVGSVDTSSVATYTIKYACRDAAGNSGQGAAQTISIRDTTAPVLDGDAPSPAYVMSGPDYTSYDGYTLTCTDDGQPANDRISFNPPLASLAERPATEPHEVEIYCPDEHDNTIDNKTAEIVVDGTDPVPPEPRDRTLEVDEAFTHGQTCEQDAGSPVDQAPELEIRDADGDEVTSVDTSSVATYTIKYACRDAAGNSGQGAAQTISIRDTTAPVLAGIAPSPAYVEAGPDYTSYPGYTLTCTDDGQPANDRIAFEPPLALLSERPAAEPHEVEIYCPDEHGNTINNKTAEIVVDDTDPVPPEPANRDIERDGVFEHGQTCTQDTGSPVTQEPELEIRDSADNVVGSVDTSSVTTYTIKYTCRDAAGNSQQGAAQMISIRDTTAPVLDGDAPSPAYVMSGPDYTSYDGYTLTCTDDGQPANDRISFNPPLASLLERPAADPHEVEIYCPDEHGNTINNKTAEIVVDDTDPVPPEPANRDIERDGVFEHGQTCTQDTGSPVTQEPELEIRDSADNVVGSVDTSSVTTYTIKYTCRDAAGNSQQGAAQMISIRDTTAPVLDGDAPSPAYVMSGPDYTSYDGYTLTCTDDGQPANDRISFNPPLASLLERPAADPHEVEIYCPDEHGNTINNKTAEIVVDDTDPVPPEPANRDIERDGVFEHGQTCTQDTGSPVTQEPELEIRDSADNVVGSVDTSSVTTYTIKYTCRDAAGNSQQGAAQMISIRDTTAPVLDGDAPSPAYVMSGPDYTSYDGYTLTCTDGGQPANDQIAFEPPLALLSERPAAEPHEVEIYCPDEHGNTINNKTAEIVVDDTDPVPPEPANRDIERDGVFEHGQTCTQDTGSPVTQEPELEIRDSADNVVGSVDTSSVTTYTIKYTCRDAAGNSQQGAAQMISIRDTTAPVLDGDAPSPAYVMSGPDYTSYDGYTLTCTDDGQPANDRISFNPPLASLLERPAADPHEVEIYCPDEHGNTINNKTADIIVDDTDPVPPEPRDRSLEVGEAFAHGQTCAQDTGSPVTEEPELEIRDSGDNVVGSVDTSSVATYTIKYTCRDAAGNSLQGAAQTISVQDTTAPSLEVRNPHNTFIMNIQEYAADASCSLGGQDLPVTTNQASLPATEGNHTVTFDCSSGQNAAPTQKRYAIVDRTDPVVTPLPYMGSVGAVISYGMPFDDPGASCDAGPSGVHSRGDNSTLLDVLAPGSQSVQYWCADRSGNNGTASRQVTVMPPSSPSLLVLGDDPVRHPYGAPYVDDGALCSDGVTPPEHITGNASMVNVTRPGPQSVAYTCHGLEDSRTVHVVDGLVFRLLGPNPMAVMLGAPYVEPRAECSMPSGSDTILNITGKVDTSKLGPYYVHYDCRAGDGQRAGATRTVNVMPRPGGEEDWHLAPTFALDWLTGERVVHGGISLDGTPHDGGDNFHADVDALAAVGANHTVTLKIHSQMVLEEAGLHLGVPDLSRATDAEASILVSLEPLPGGPPAYLVTGVRHDQSFPLLDVGATSASARPAPCGAGERDCLAVDITFRLQARPAHGIFAVSAMDTERRYTVTYANSGIDVTGESLLPPETASFVIKRGNQHPAEWVHLVRDDPRHDIWEDQHGFAWYQNSYGSWIRMTHAEFERLADPHASVMTRSHGLFDLLVEAERLRAELVFNSSAISSEIGGSFSHDAPVRIDKLDDPEILERLRAEELEALERLGGR